jgi:hypothetical protein
MCTPRWPNADLLFLVFYGWSHRIGNRLGELFDPAYQYQKSWIQTCAIAMALRRLGILRISTPLFVCCCIIRLLLCDDHVFASATRASGYGCPWC